MACSIISRARHAAELFGWLQRLEILDQIVAFLVGELPADDAIRIGLLVGIRRRLKGMAEHAVALDFLAVAVRRREQGLPRLARGFTGSRHSETDLFRVEVARAQAELFWPLGLRRQHPV